MTSRIDRILWYVLLAAVVPLVGLNIKKDVDQFIGDSVRILTGKPLEGRLIQKEPATIVARIDDTVDEQQPPTGASDLDGLAYRYAPVVYLHPEEVAWPIDPADYFTFRETEVRELGTNRVIVPAGFVTFAELDRLFREMRSEGVESRPWYISVPNKILRGAVPLREGVIRTPMYYTAAASEDGNWIYISYLFFYAYNAPYPIIFEGKTLIVGDKYDFQNAHEADLEHVTLKIDAHNQQLASIFFAAHGSHEGGWVNADRLEFSNPMQQPAVPAGHPIVYSARYSHASYWKPGTWVRVFGMANDYTARGRIWFPELRRLDLHPLSGHRDAASDVVAQKYVADAAGWSVFPGSYGRRGVGTVYSRDWYFMPERSTRTQEEAERLYCAPGDNMCALRAAAEAIPPGETAGWAKRVRDVLRAREHAREAIYKIAQGVKEGAEKSVKAVEKAARDAQRLAEKTAAQAKMAAEKAKREADKAARQAKKAAERAVAETRKVAEKAAEETRRAAEKAAQETKSAATRAYESVKNAAKKGVASIKKFFRL